MLRSLTTLFCLNSLLLVGCFKAPHYQGYKMKPYVIQGKTYTPMSIQEAVNYSEIGIASWYNESRWAGLKRGNTAIGEKVMPWDLIAAHKTLPLPSRVRVTNLSTGKSLVLRVNDRGPFIEGRIIDLSERAAKKLGFHKLGLIKVKVETLSVGDGDYQKFSSQRP